MKEVETLEELISELSEAETIASLAVETLLHAILSHHIIHCDMLSDLAGEIKEGDILSPVVVVDKLRTVWGVALEIEEFGKLLLDALLIMTESLLIEEVALSRLPRRVADHTGGAAYESERLVSATLEMAEHHHAAEVSDMKRIGCGVDSKVSSGHLFLQLLVCARHHGVDHAAPGQFFNEIHI